MNRALISTIELFEIDLPSCRHHSLGWLDNCRIGLLKLPYSGEEGLAEGLLCSGKQAFDLVQWGCCLRYLCGLTLEEAITATAMHILKLPDHNQYPLALMALLDVRSRLEHLDTRTTVDDMGRPLDAVPLQLNRTAYAKGGAASLRIGGGTSLAISGLTAALETEDLEKAPVDRLPLLGPEFPTDTPALIRRSSAYLSLFGASTKNRHSG
ncbi:hypothetical protein FHS19_003648 [Paenibacillus rhizosphaerae]|uniref:Uncharacterized protein n=1 Tax=Paenibacillus rhizosphaerae TaxID=297318 RepID=A0A839TR28_9BACL|nr:hypothetical protein [Paenibacillus rhizosphaerae]MBB3128973.1 hypothetical protein [Paenibacillus rhizosphaerae]